MASALYKNYLELRKMREVRLHKLQDQQKKVQHHERSLFKIKNYIAKVMTETACVEEKFNEMVQNNVWVTAKDHDKIHNVRQHFAKELVKYNTLLEEKQQSIEQEADSAKVHASHIIGIERALTCLEDQMRQEVHHLPPSSTTTTKKAITTTNKKVNPMVQRQQQKVEQPIFFRRSDSVYSFASIISANSTNSTSLSGALLKKWLIHFTTTTTTVYFNHLI